MYTSLILAAIVAAQISGDYFIKVATAQSAGLISYTFVLGALLYGATAIGWYFLMQRHSLAEIGVLFSASTIILLAVLGHFVFKEAISLRQLAGLSLAILSVIVMRKAD